MRAAIGFYEEAGQYLYLGGGSRSPLLPLVPTAVLSSARAMDHTPSYLDPERNSPRTFEGIDPDLFSIVTSTNRTESNLTGPGRLVGRLISRGGRKIEGVIGSLATRMGYGPAATAGNAYKPAKHVFRMCPRSHEYLEGLISMKESYRVAPYTANHRFTDPELCRLYCMGCRSVYYKEVITLPAFKKAVKQLLQFTQSPDICTQLVAVEWIYWLASYHSSLHDYVVGQGAFIALDTLRNSLRLSTSEQHLRLKGAIDIALELLEDDSTVPVLETLFSLEASSTEVERRLAASRVSRITQSISGQMPISAMNQIAYKRWYCPRDHSAYLGLTDCFPSRSVIGNALLRMGTAPPGCFACREIRGFICSLLNWLSCGSEHCHKYYWIQASQNLWIALLRFRSQTTGMHWFPWFQKYIAPITDYHCTLPPFPLSKDSALLSKGCYLLSGCHTSEPPKLLTFPELVWAVMFKREGALEEPFVSWVRDVVNVIDTY